MQLRSSGIVTAIRAHGETAVIARFLTPDNGLVAAYVAGGRGRHMRPVLVPGNHVAADIRARTSQQLPYAKVELITSRAPWLSEPLPAAAINWTSALTASVLPERQTYPQIYNSLSALLDAICHAPSARGWLPGLITYEALLLRELGYGEYPAASEENLPDLLTSFRALETPIGRYLLAERAASVMAARSTLSARLERMVE